MYLKVLLHESIGQDVLLGGLEAGLPLVTCCIDYLYNVRTGVDGVDGSAVRYRFAVNGYGLNGSEGVRITVGPGNLYVAIGHTAGYVGYRNLLDGSVNDDAVLAGLVACCILTVEHVLAGLVKLCTRGVCLEAGGSGLLYVAGFAAYELDVISIGIGSAANCLTVNVELCGGDLSVDGDRIGVRLISCFIHCVERVGSFSSESRTGGVRYITGSAGLLHVDRVQTDCIACSELDGACVGSAARCRRGRTCIQSSGGFGVIEGNCYNRGLVPSSIYAVERVGSFGRKLSTARIRGVVTRTGHLHIYCIYAGKRV